MTYNYKLSYCSYDDGNSIILSHTKKFSKEEIIEMLSNCMAPFAVKRRIETSDEEDEEDDDWWCRTTVDIGELWVNSTQLMMDKFGFTHIDLYIPEISCNGCDYVFEEHDQDGSLESEISRKSLELWENTHGTNKGDEIS